MLPKCFVLIVACIVLSAGNAFAGLCGSKPIPSRKTVPLDTVVTVAPRGHRGRRAHSESELEIKSPCLVTILDDEEVDDFVLSPRNRGLELIASGSSFRRSYSGELSPSSRNVLKKLKKAFRDIPALKGDLGKIERQVAHLDKGLLDYCGQYPVLEASLALIASGVYATRPEGCDDMTFFIFRTIYDRRLEAIRELRALHKKIARQEFLAAHQRRAVAAGAARARSSSRE